MIELLSVALSGFIVGTVFEMLLNEWRGTTDIRIRCKNLELTRELEETKKELATYKHYWLVHNLEEEVKEL